jgi:hypothetical protein
MAVKRTADGRFVKGGSSPNPGGRPRGVIADLQREMRGHTALATATLVSICANPEARDSDRIAAAREILDRGHGKALQPISAGIDRLTIGVVTAAANKHPGHRGSSWACSLFGAAGRRAELNRTFPVPTGSEKRRAQTRSRLAGRTTGRLTLSF